MTLHPAEDDGSSRRGDRPPTGAELERWLQAIDRDTPPSAAALGPDAGAEQFAELQALHGTRAALRTWFALENRVLQAGSSPLDAVAVAAAREHFGLDRGRRRQYRWPVLVSGVAAGLLASLFLWSRSGAPTDSSTHLGGGLALQFHAATGELELPPLAAGCFYRVEFLAGGQVVAAEGRLRQPRLRLPPLAAYPGPVRVRALLMQGGAGGEPAAWSDEVEVPAAMIR
jgi:hypothetical protein